MRQFIVMVEIMKALFCSMSDTDSSESAGFADDFWFRRGKWVLRVLHYKQELTAAPFTVVKQTAQ